MSIWESMESLYHRSAHVHPSPRPAPEEEAVLLDRIRAGDRSARDERPGTGEKRALRVGKRWESLTDRPGPSLEQVFRRSLTTESNGWQVRYFDDASDVLWIGEVHRRNKCGFLRGA